MSKKYSIEFDSASWYYGTIACAAFGAVNYVLVGVVLATLPIFMIIQAFVLK